MKRSCRSRLQGGIAPYSTARRTDLKRLLPDTVSRAPENRKDPAGLTLQPGPRLSHNEAPFPNALEPDGANPFPVLQRPRHDCLGVFRGQYRAVRVVEHFRRRRAKQEPAKAASMRGHHDQIEFMYLCGFRNHIRRITAQKYAPGFCSGKLRFKKKLKLRSARLQCSLAMSIAGRA